MSRELIFVRPASGLTRAIGPTGAIFMALTPSLGPFWWTYTAQLPVIYPGLNLPLTFALGGIFVFIIGFGDGLLMSAIPRSGGDYVIFSRCLGPFFGSLEAWRSIIQNPIAAAIGSYFAGASIGSTIMVAGALTKAESLISMGTSIVTNPWVVITLGIILMAVGAVVDYLGPGLLSKWMTFWGIIGLIGIVFSIALFATHPPGTIQESWDNIWGRGAYDEVVEIATKNGWTPTPFSWDVQASALLIPTAMLWPYNALPVAGEVSRPKATLMLSSTGSAVILSLLSIVTSAAFVYSYGDFATMYNYIIMNGFADQFKINPVIAAYFPVSLAFFAGCLTTIHPLSIFINTVPILVNWGNISSGFYWTTRPLFALSFDRYAPEVFTKLSRFHSPTYSIIFTFLFSIPFIILSAFNYVVATINLFIMFAFCDWFESMSQIVLPFLRRHIWERGLTWTIGGFPVITINGIIYSAIASYLIMTGALGMDISSILSVIMIYTIGGAFYAIYSFRNQKKGIDVSKIFADLPPE